MKWLWLSAVAKMGFDFFMTAHNLIGYLQMHGTWKLLIYNRSTALENIDYKT